MMQIHITRRIAMRVRELLINLINVFTGIVETFLALRFVLKMFGANPNSGFVAWVYEMSGGLLDPFRAIFPTKVFENTYVLEFSTIFAMLVYALFAFLLVALVNALTPADPVTVVRKR